MVHNLADALLRPSLYAAYSRIAGCSEAYFDSQRMYNTSLSVQSDTLLLIHMNHEPISTQHRCTVVFLLPNSAAYHMRAETALLNVSTQLWAPRARCPRRQRKPPHLISCKAKHRSGKYSCALLHLVSLTSRPEQRSHRQTRLVSFRPLPTNMARQRAFLHSISHRCHPEPRANDLILLRIPRRPCRTPLSTVIRTHQQDGTVGRSAGLCVPGTRPDLYNSGACERCRLPVLPLWHVVMAG